MRIQLYHRWHCPFSARVRSFIEEHRIEDQIEFIELNEVAGAADRLERIAGQTQVPCLVVDGQPLLESAEIIQWLHTNLATYPTGAMFHSASTVPWNAALR